jgi:serine/threonine protein kinase
MHATPAGFTFLPGIDRPGEGVFGVQRDGARHVCKRLPPRALGEGWMRERLAAEGRLLGMLDGRGAPRLVASGEDAHGPWIVMELVPWPELGSGAGSRDGGWLERAARSAFAALAAVHGAGVVHADISPRNVLVADDGLHAALVDFGLARASFLPAMPPGPFRGTLAFTAPEVARGEPFDARADLFSMAACLLYAWSAQVPRAHESDAAMLVAAGEESLLPWAERAARGLAEPLARALVACCASEPRARAPHAAEVLASESRPSNAER